MRHIALSHEALTLSSQIRLIHCHLTWNTYIVISHQTRTLSSHMRHIHCHLTWDTYIVISHETNCHFTWDTLSSNMRRLHSSFHIRHMYTVSSNMRHRNCNCRWDTYIVITHVSYITLDIYIVSLVNRWCYFVINLIFLCSNIYKIPLTERDLCFGYLYNLAF